MLEQTGCVSEARVISVQAHVLKTEVGSDKFTKLPSICRRGDTGDAVELA